MVSCHITLCDWQDLDQICRTQEMKHELKNRSNAKMQIIVTLEPGAKTLGVKGST